jgi:hypothetical protein
MKKLVIALMLPAAVAAGECVLQSKTATNGRAQILERSALTQTVTPEINGKKRCIVSFRARIGNQWLTAHGDQSFDLAQSEKSACNIALTRAEAEVQSRGGQTSVSTESVVVCSDRPEHQTIRKTTVGTVGLVSQFRPHPDRNREFWHNGARCRWFLDTEFHAQDIAVVQGIICQMQDAKWIVVDKF